jgi:hypothetical protein
MSGNGKQHIGDDQFVHGLPKHMVAVAGNDENTYWEIVPEENACATCRSLRGMRFEKNPVPVHPNCACEVIRVPPPKRQPYTKASGRLQGYEDYEVERFRAGQVITVTIKNLGPFSAAAWLRVDRTEWKATRYLSILESESIVFSKFGDTPMEWEVFIINLSLDGSTIDYEIRG